jgi:1-acyl-sn-glycerol-3-phosphate acyltransferase
MSQTVDHVIPLMRRQKIGFEGAAGAGDIPSLLHGAGGPIPARWVRAAGRGAVIVGLTLPGMLIQALCLALPGAPKRAFPRLYWRLFSRTIGLRVRVIGELATRDTKRPVIFVSNHSSWVDIPVVGGVLPAAFIAKQDVAGWPLVGTIARLGRTVFVSRKRGSTARERDEMRTRLDNGEHLILFPEGTSSDGSRVLPFRSSFFALADGGDRRPLIQPVSVVCDQLNGLPAGRSARPAFAWYGDMDIASHFWRMTEYKEMRVTVLLHDPLDPATFPDRKSLTRAVWNTVADGAAMLRQNRDPRPLTVTTPGQASA